MPEMLEAGKEHKKFSWALKPDEDHFITAFQCQQSGGQLLVLLFGFEAGAAILKGKGRILQCFLRCIRFLWKKLCRCLSDLSV